MPSSYYLKANIGKINKQTDKNSWQNYNQTKEKAVDEIDVAITFCET